MLSSGLFPAPIEVVELTTNVYRSLARDSAIYADLDTFNPGPYLDPSYSACREPLTELPTIRVYHGFGFGRRICPGQEVAEAELLVAWAALPRPLS